MTPETLIFPGYESLSESEKNVFALFEKHQNDNLWSLAITNVVKNPSLARFRRLTSDLKSQNDDNAEVMKKILGNCYDAVIAL